MPENREEWQADKPLFYIYYFAKDGSEGATGGYGDIKSAEEKAERMKARGYIKTDIIFTTFEEIINYSTQVVQQRVEELVEGWEHPEKKAENMVE